jgi:hypothetical protein
MIIFNVPGGGERCLHGPGQFRPEVTVCTHQLAAVTHRLQTVRNCLQPLRNCLQPLRNCLQPLRNRPRVDIAG